MAGVVVLAWLRSPVRVFEGPMNQLTHLADPHMHMSHGLVRLMQAGKRSWIVREEMHRVTVRLTVRDPVLALD
jgi:hypothetical protein